MNRLTEFADEFQIDIQLAYYPPYHSKYNPIERVWGVLEQPLKTSKVLTVGQTLKLGNGFTVSIDKIYRDSPRKALITLFESGVKKDEKTVGPGEIYSYDNRVSMNIEKIFAGPTFDAITIDISN